jgi:hypothetical protein
MEFSAIRAVFEKNHRSSILFLALFTLKRMQEDDARKYPHWIFLIIIKWAFQFADDQPSKSPISLEAWEQLLVDTEQFETEYAGMCFKTSESVRKAFMILAYQQFAQQESYRNYFISRQFVLFLKTKQRQFDIEAAFRKKADMSLQAFLRYWYLTVLYFHLDLPFTLDALDQNYFEFFKTYYPNADCEIFLRLITIARKEDVDSLHRMKDERMQLYETNCFITKPLILFRQNYCLPHRSLLAQTAKHFVYNYMKSVDGFPDELGKRMEDYVEIGLREAGVPYRAENWLKERYGKGKIVDYWLDENILVECKATELSPRTGIIRDATILASDLRTSIIKAYIQLIATATRIDSKTEWFGIVISYKEMHLGFGEDAWNEFMNESVTQVLRQEEFSLDTLPPHNLFFLSLEDWDYIMQVLKNGKTKFQDVLTKARELNQNQNIAERVMMMEQVLHKHFPIDFLNLSYLTDAETHYRIRRPE